MTRILIKPDYNWETVCPTVIEYCKHEDISEKLMKTGRARREREENYASVQRKRGTVD